MPERLAVSDNCVACHMPQSGSVDIPHVTVHDHKIKIPIKQKQLSKIKEFAGLYCVNQQENSVLSKAIASLNYYEKFEGESAILDTANYWIQNLEDLPKQRNVKIHLFYLQSNWAGIVEQAKALDLNKELDAWTCYRVGQAYQNLGRFQDAQIGFERALFLASSNIDFINKIAVLQIQQGQFSMAKLSFEKSLGLQPKQAEALVNYGFSLANLNQIDLAFAAYKKALQLDPDFQQAWLNLASLHLLKNNKTEAILALKKVLQLNPKQAEVKALLNQLLTQK
jgi:tetratricopeptide (TPR) repeat protein